MKTSSKIRGLTLIELLVAITIFAILGIMSYRAISQAVDSRERLETEYNNWQRLARTFARVETDIQQLGIRQGSVISVTSQPPLWVGKNNNGFMRLVFWRLDAEVGARLTGFEFTGNTFDLLRWPTADLSQPPQREALLSHVKNVSWSFLADGDTTWATSWPPSQARKNEIPAGIRINLEQEGTGKISRTFALK